MMVVTLNRVAVGKGKDQKRTREEQKRMRRAAWWCLDFDDFRQNRKERCSKEKRSIERGARRGEP